MAKPNYKAIVDDAVKEVTKEQFNSYLELQKAIENNNKILEEHGDLGTKIEEMKIKERSLLIIENENITLRNQLDNTKSELAPIKKSLIYKEEALLKREEDLTFREQSIMNEKREIDKMFEESGGVNIYQMKIKLEDLQNELKEKVKSISEREKYVQAKTKELEFRESGLIEEEIDAMGEDRGIELKVEKVKTGDRRLDDLLLGGIPFGSNIAIYGPPFTGKEITINNFIAEGIRKGVPAICVLTDKLPSEFREEMQFVISGLEQYEKLGLVKYIDAYSRSIGIDEVEPNIRYVDDFSDTEGITKSVNETAADLLKTHKYYRLGFRGLSSIIAFEDATKAYKFLQPFVGRRKNERAVSMYTIEKGMHDDQDVQKVSSLMDGMIDYKIEQLKTYLAIKGICDVQSRSWIDYTHSRQGLNIGSFSLDHIRDR